MLAFLFAPLSEGARNAWLQPARGSAEFTLQPDGDATNLTWAMHGPNLYIGKVIGIFVNMDTMIGKDFETGLANLKAVSEK